MGEFCEFGGWGLVAGSWELVVGDWGLGAGDWKLLIIGPLPWDLEIGIWELVVPWPFVLDPLSFFICHFSIEYSLPSPPRPSLHTERHCVGTPARPCGALRTHPLFS